MRPGGEQSCLPALGGQKVFRKERKRMASGNGLPSPSALVAKRPSALGPFPRFVWIHQDTPQDSLDEICHEIWKRVQGLPKALKPRTSLEKLSAPMPGTISFQEQALELSDDKDEISLLVEQEFLSLTKEYLILLQESSGELMAPGSASPGTQELAPCFLMPPLGDDSIEYPEASVIVGDQLWEQKLDMSVSGGRQDCDSATYIVTGILSASKVKSAKETEDMGSPSASSSEIGKLLAQFPLKPTETSKTPDNETVPEETKVVKDLLQDGTFSGSASQEPMGLGPFSPVPAPSRPPPLPDKLPELSAPKRQLPVFANICSKTEADLDGHRWREQNPGTKGLAKGLESIFLSQCIQSQKETCGEEGPSGPVGTMSMGLPTKKPGWPPEKNLLYELFGSTKNQSSPLRLRSKVEVDGLELKFNPPVTAADKSSIKYAGNVLTPRFATALTSTTLNQPLWLNLNCPPPPMFTNHSTFPQYHQGLYPQRSARMLYQQAVRPSVGCYSRQVTPYSPQQVGQQIFLSFCTPLMSYTPIVQSSYSYPQRTPQKLPAVPRDPPPMAGDGPQHLFPQGYGFSSASSGPMMSSTNFSSSGKGIHF